MDRGRNRGQGWGQGLGQEQGASTGAGFGGMDRSGAAKEFYVNQEVWYNSPHYRDEYQATIKKVYTWDREKYDIEYTGPLDNSKKHAANVEKWRLRPCVYGEKPRTRLW